MRLEIAVPDLSAETQQRIVGVDVGQSGMWQSPPTPRTARYSFWQSGSRARGPLCPAAEGLQDKGTRSAARRLIVLTGRGRRLKQERNHVISRRTVDAYPHSLFGLESLEYLEYLTYIRERTRRNRSKRASTNRGWSGSDRAPSTLDIEPYGCC